jgi:hypothetical protein
MSTFLSIPFGYISAIVGANTASVILGVDSETDETDNFDSFSRSLGNVRGYESRSSCGAN